MLSDFRICNFICCHFVFCFVRLLFVFVMLGFIRLFAFIRLFGCYCNVRFVIGYLFIVVMLMHMCE